MMLGIAAAEETYSIYWLLFIRPTLCCTLFLVRVRVCVSMLTIRVEICQTFFLLYIHRLFHLRCIANV